MWYLSLSRNGGFEPKWLPQRDNDEQRWELEYIILRQSQMIQTIGVWSDTTWDRLGNMGPHKKHVGFDWQNGFVRQWGFNIDIKVGL